MSADELTLDVRSTIALWVTEGLTIREMCVALRITQPSMSRDAMQYITMRACAAALAMLTPKGKA